jgi:predicted kinase
MYSEILNKIFNLQKLSFDELKRTSEFDVCVGSPENQLFHDETTDEHIELMINHLFNRIDTPNDNWIVLYLCVIFHDFRKPQTISTDENGIYHNIDHDLQGSIYIWDFVHKAKKEEFNLTLDRFKLINRASKIIRWHMIYHVDRLGENTLKRFISTFSIDELCLLIEFQKVDHVSSKKEREEVYFDGKLEEMIQRRYQIFNYMPERDDIYFQILFGAPGSGKSLYTSKIDKSNTVILSPDELRKELLNDERDRKNHVMIFGELQQRAKKILSFEKKNVVLDATSTVFDLRQNFVKIAHQRQIPLIFTVFLTPLEICLKNNSIRKRNVDPNGIREVYERAEMPCGVETERVEYMVDNNLYLDYLKIY